MTDGELASFLVVNKDIDDDGGMVLEVRSLGASSSALTARLSSIFNRKVNFIHVCTGIGYCTREEGVAFHLDSLRLADPTTYEADYLTANGKRRLKEGITALDYGGEEPSGKHPAKQPGKEAKKDKKTQKEKPKKDQKAPGRGASPRKEKKKRDRSPAQEQVKRTKKTDAEDNKNKLEELRRTLAELKKKQAGQDGEVPSEAGGEAAKDGEESESSSSSVQAVSLADGWELPSLGTELKVRPALTDMTARKSAEERKGLTTKLSKQLNTGNMDGKLAMNAALIAEGRQQKKNGGPGDPDPDKDKKAEKKKKKKKKKDGSKKEKKKSKKKKKKKGDGGGSGSSGSSGSGKKKKKSSSSSEESSSDSVDLLPPLQRKSENKPGAVFQLLLDKVEEHLSAVGEFHARSGAGIGGTKILTYYNALIKGGVNPSSRDGREMYLISVSLDLLRSGLLAKMADGLAARFFALHQAAIDGSWQAARNLEIHAPDLLSAAGTQVTIAARKHGKLLQKMQGHHDERGEPWRKNQWQGNWNQNSKGWNDQKGKGKKGKGKTKEDPWQKGKGRWQGAQQAWEGNPANKEAEKKEAPK